MIGVPDAPPDAGPDQGAEGVGIAPGQFGPILFLTVKDVAPFPAHVLAVSNEPLLVHVSAEDVLGNYLSADDIIAVGLEMCFVLGTDAPAFDAAWYPLTIENRQIGRVYAPAWLIVGPEVEAGSGPSLTAGTYNRFVRTMSEPRVVRKLSPLTVEGPNP